MAEQTDVRLYAPQIDNKLGPQSGIPERFSINLPQEEPWLRLTDEPLRQWRAFVAYRDLGSQRNVQKAADIAGENYSTVRSWLTKWEWGFRVEQFDRYVQRISAQQVMAEHANMLGRHASIALALQEKALQRLQSMDASELTVKDTLAFLKESVVIERNARDAIEAGTVTPEPEKEIEKRLDQDAGQWMGELAQILADAGAIPQGSSIEDITNVIDGYAVEIEDDDSSD